MNLFLWPGRLHSLLNFILFFQSQVWALPIDPDKLASEIKMSDQTIRVKLSNLGNVLQIKGRALGLSLAQKPELGNIRAEEWVVDCKRSLIIHPVTGKARMLPRAGVLIESLSGILSINQKHFRDQVVVYPSQLLSPYDSSVRNNTQCLVVNHLNVEHYLEGVVNAEFNSKWAESAVEAQIIAARSYALFQMKEMRKDKGKVFDVESTQKDQVYLGMDRVDTKATELVNKTKGMILVDETLKLHRKIASIPNPIKAFYHSSCGGSTILPQEVWGDKKTAGFHRRSSCGFCNQSPTFLWDYRLSFYEIQQKLLKGVRSDEVGRASFPAEFYKKPDRWLLNEVHLEAASKPAERIKNIIFKFKDMNASGKSIQVKLDAYRARNWLDPARLKSTWFKIKSLGRSILFEGRGSGHGVGLCQWGAKKMGELGNSREKILSHYYPKSKIVRLW